MTVGLQLVLLLFALIGFGGAGAALAVGRHRDLVDDERDYGMFGVAFMLFLFGALCTVVSVGLAGVPAFGGVALWASYIIMAENVGLFRVEVAGPGDAVEEASETPRSHR